MLLHIGAGRLEITERQRRRRKQKEERIEAFVRGTMPIFLPLPLLLFCPDYKYNAGALRTSLCVTMKTCYVLSGVSTPWLGERVKIIIT